MRKWADQDVQDLKRLIQLMVRFIENSHALDEYRRTMKRAGADTAPNGTVIPLRAGAQAS